MEGKTRIGALTSHVWTALKSMAHMDRGGRIDDTYEASKPLAAHGDASAVEGAAQAGDAKAGSSDALGCPYMKAMAEGQTPKGGGRCPVMDIKAPDTGLTDPTQPASPEHLAELRDTITNLQKALVKAGVVDDIGRLFHRKQLWGGMAQVQIQSELPPEYQNSWIGDAAAQGKPLKIAMRMSDGLPCPGAGIKPDVRGLTFKVEAPDGTKRDILMTNGINPAMNTEEFVEFAKVVTTMLTQGNIAVAKDIISEIQSGHYKTPEVLRMAAKFGWDTRPRYQHPAGQSYWSQPVKLGDVMGRYRLDAVKGDASKPGIKGWFHYFFDKDYERHAMEKDVANHDVHMRLVFEAFTNGKALTNQSIHGDHVDTDLGTITIKQRDPNSLRRAEEESTVSRMQFNQGHNATPDSHPVGTMGDTRTTVYDTSAGNRHALTDDSPEVKRFFSLPEDPTIPDVNSDFLIRS